jgi:hypothetical protein
LAHADLLGPAENLIRLAGPVKTGSSKTKGRNNPASVASLSFFKEIIFSRQKAHRLFEL